jgi:Fe-S cluster biogenesis protein NfuA/nitrite reductase/ring-hydroxylating ferredoxin subunit
MEARRMTGVQEVSARVEELLDALKSGGFGGAASAAEELVSLLVGLYGDGLGRVMAVLAESGPDGEAIIARLVDDPLVESLLLLHDLHPLDVDARIQRALDRVRPYLGSHAGGVQYLGVADGIARLKLEGSCHGCPSSTVTVQLAITGAVQDAAPEVTEVVVEGVTEQPRQRLLQIGRRPDPPEGDEVLGLTSADAGVGGLSGGIPPTVGAPPAVWVVVPDIGPPSSRPVSTSADGVSIVVCSVRGTLYAYRDSCAGCASSLADGQLNREELICPACGARYNVRLAGKGIDDPALHLDPLPLLADSLGVRVAVPEAVR